MSWGPIRDHRLRTSDGQDIGAWFVEGREDDDTPQVLLLHGNKGSRANSLKRAEFLASAGYPVLMISLRAHGDSSGDFNDIGYSARHDVVAAVEFLEQKHPGRPIVVMGVSLGSAAAIFASQELGRRVHGYILESPYQDLKTAVWNRTQTYLPPVLAQVGYAGLRRSVRYSYRTLMRSPRSRPSPASLRRAGLDPGGRGRPAARPGRGEGAAGAGRRPRGLLLFPGAGHNNLFPFGPGRLPSEPFWASDHSLSARTR